MCRVHSRRKYTQMTHQTQRHPHVAHRDITLGTTHVHAGSSSRKHTSVHVLCTEAYAPSWATAIWCVHVACTEAYAPSWATAIWCARIDKSLHAREQNGQRGLSLAYITFSVHTKTKSPRGVINNRHDFLSMQPAIHATQSYRSEAAIGFLTKGMTKTSISWQTLRALNFDYL